MQKHIKFYSVSEVFFSLHSEAHFFSDASPPSEGRPWRVYCIYMCIHNMCRYVYIYIYVYITCSSKLILCWWKHHFFVDVIFWLGNQALLPTAEMLQHVEGPYTAILQVASWWLLVQSDFLTNWEVYQISWPKKNWSFRVDNSTSTIRKMHAVCLFTGRCSKFHPQNPRHGPFPSAVCIHHRGASVFLGRFFTPSGGGCCAVDG